MKDRLEVINERYEQISKDLLDINIVSDIKKMTALSKEQRSLEKIVEKYRALLACESNITELKELVHENDPEIREMAEMELVDAAQTTIIGYILIAMSVITIICCFIGGR
jgi:peptide chain release factor 1